MRRFFPIIAVLALVGFGCSSVPAAPADTTVYANEQYGFAFEYPPNVEVRVREEENRETTYLGLYADFFASVRDTVRDKKATNIFFLYALPGATVDSFVAALVASSPDGAVEVKFAEDVEMNGLAMKKVTSTTELGTDKVHYLFASDAALVVVSVFLAEEPAFDPILRTFRPE